ncbi:MAG: hypothetical protein ABEJ82_06190 [Haloplanus sp.]
MWVRSEYAGELAVLSTWLSVFIPWNVMYSPGIAGGSLLFVRFPFVQVRYSFGVPLAKALAVSDPFSAVAFQRGQSIRVAYELWLVGAAVLAVAVVVSLVYYRRESWVESWAVDSVRLLGALLSLTGLLFAGATYLLVTRGFPGVPVPVGVVFLLVFGVVLTTVERTDGDGDARADAERT